jgi:hypothetical protein
MPFLKTRVRRSLGVLNVFFSILPHHKLKKIRDAEGTLDPWNARGTQEGRHSKERDGTVTIRRRDGHGNKNVIFTVVSCN